MTLKKDWYTKLILLFSACFLFYEINRLCTTQKAQKTFIEQVNSFVESNKPKSILMQKDYENFLRLKNGSYISYVKEDDILNQALSHNFYACDLSHDEYNFYLNRYFGDVLKLCPIWNGTSSSFLNELIEIEKKIRIYEAGINMLHGNNCHWLYPSLGVVKDPWTNLYYISERYSHETTWLYEIQIENQIKTGLFPKTFYLDIDRQREIEVITRKYQVLLGTGKIDTTENCRIVPMKYLRP